MNQVGIIAQWSNVCLECVRPRVQSPIPQEGNFTVGSDRQYLEAGCWFLSDVRLLAVKMKSCLEQIVLLPLVYGQRDAGA